MRRDTGTLRKPKSNFTQISNYLINDKNLSSGAKGIYMYIMSKPEGWKYYLDEIVSKTSDSKYAVKKYIKELEMNGYLLRKAVHKGGRFKGWDYYIFHEPKEDVIETNYKRKEKMSKSNKTDRSNTDRSNTERLKFRQSEFVAMESNTKKDSNTNDSNTKKGKTIVEYEEIVNYLNEKSDKNYKSTTEKTRSFIRARTKEGFTIEDFKTVIDKKCKQWKDDPTMNRYLRPETLFSPKFEGYLNEEVGKIEQRYKRNSKEDRLRKIKDPANYM